MFKCRDCQREVMDGDGLCITCFALHIKPCPNCMLINKKGVWARRPKFKGRYAVDCSVCKNEMFTFDPSPQSS